MKTGLSVDKKKTGILAHLPNQKENFDQTSDNRALRSITDPDNLTGGCLFFFHIHKVFRKHFLPFSPNLYLLPTVEHLKKKNPS